MSKPMTHKRLVSAFLKAGMTVKQMADRRSNPGYVATNPKTGECVEWHTQASFVYDKVKGEGYYDEKNPVTSHVTARHPDTDAMYDLFMDSYYDTIKSAVKAIV